jgi:hypothetical protein
LVPFAWATSLHPNTVVHFLRDVVELESSFLELCRFSGGYSHYICTRKETKKNVQREIGENSIPVTHVDGNSSKVVKPGLWNEN